MKRAIALALMTTSLMSYADQKSTKDLELNLSLNLSSSQISNIENCEERLEHVRETLNDVNRRLAENGESLSFSNTDSVVQELCTNIKKSHEERIQQEKNMKELYAAVGEKPNKALNYFSAKDGEEKIWSFDIQLGGAIHSGNSDFKLIDTGVTTIGNFESHSLTIITKGQFKETDNETYRKFGIQVNDSIQLNKMSSLSNKWGAFWDVYLNRDEEKGIEENVDALIGLGYNVLGNYSGAKEKIKISMALGYRSRANIDGTQEDNPIASTIISLEKKLAENISVRGRVSHLANLDNTNEDYELKTDLGLSIKINDKSSLFLGYEKSFDNTPVAGKEKSDNAFKVSYQHKF